MGFSASYPVVLFILTFYFYFCIIFPMGYREEMKQMRRAIANLLEKVKEA